MAMRCDVVALALMALPVCAQSTLPPEVLLLSRIRHHAVADLAHLPNFTCLETIERSTRSSPLKPFDVKDVVRVEVAHVGDRDLFAWPGATKFETRPLAEMVNNGMTSNGEFRSHASAVFEGDAVIHYGGEEEMGGHRAAHFMYEISPAFSGYTIHVNGGTGTIGVRGTFWADLTTFDLLRLTVEGTEIPDQLGVRATLTSIDYARLHIADRDYLLPQSAVIWMGHDSGRENRNRVDFTHCRQYATESVLSFADTPEAGATPTVPATVEVTLPPGLTVSMRLETPIDVASAKVGDALSASLNDDLKLNGKAIAPKGSAVSGRIRLFQKEQRYYMVGVEFTDLTFEGGRARFIAKLEFADPRYTTPRLTATHRTDRSQIAGNIEIRSFETETPPELPGVGTFFIPATTTQLPKGMVLTWKTVGFGK